MLLRPTSLPDGRRASTTIVGATSASGGQLLGSRPIHQHMWLFACAGYAHGRIGFGAAIKANGFNAVKSIIQYRKGIVIADGYKNAVAGGLGYANVFALPVVGVHLVAFFH